MRKYADFNILKSLPTFYKEVFCSFNESKTILPFNRLNDDLFLQQPIWNNLYFIVNSKPLLFRNWLSSGIMYVKDLYDNGGNFHSIVHFQDIIVNKSNWLCEYKVLKNVFTRFSARCDCTKGQYINIVKKQHFLFCNKYEDICTKKSNFFYDILLKRKFQKPCYQSILARDFDITVSIWQTIYDIIRLNISWTVILLNSTIRFWIISYVLIIIWANGKLVKQSIEKYVQMKLSIQNIWYIIVLLQREAYCIGIL